jgi:hypothetical protein
MKTLRKAATSKDSNNEIRAAVLQFKISKALLSKGKAIHVTGRGGPYGLRDVKAPTFSLENRLTGGGKVVSLMRRPHFTPQEDARY